MVSGSKMLQRVLIAAIVLTLLGLAFMMWGLFGRGPVPIFLAMTLGQAIGTLAFALYLFVIAMEFWRTHGPPAGNSEPDREE